MRGTSPRGIHIGVHSVSSPRIAVLGAGANGASIGADLTRAGLDVSLIEQWPEHVRAMRAGGIRVEMSGPDGDDETQVTPVAAYDLCQVATMRQKFDVVLLLVKAYDSRWATQLIEPLLADDGIVAGVQNGMTTQVIADVVGAHRTMGTVIEISSTMYDPGVVHRHSNPSRSWFAVGAMDDAASGREEDVASLLRHAGAVEVVDNIQATKWMKLVSNATTLVTTASLGLSMVDALEYPGMRELMVRSGKEALAAGKAQGFPVLPIFGLTADDITDEDALVDTLLDTLYRGFVMPNTTTTVLQDWTKGRRSEVDELNGEVVAASSRHGLDAPVNRAVVEVGHRIEAGSLEAGVANLDLLLELAASEGNTND